MTGDSHAHPRPCPADLRAAIDVTRAVLDGGGHAEAHAAATGRGICPACVAVAAASLGTAIVSTVRGDKTFTSEQSRQVMLAALDAAQAELGAAPN
jgi:hypothetical protein